MQPLRVVVDCNVYVSLLIGGTMERLKDFLISENADLILSEKLFAEIDEQATKTKFAKYFTPAQAQELVDLLRMIGTLVNDAPAPPAISRDPDDDYLLALSKAAKADVLITGDKDLLVLEKHGRTRILTARSFAKEFLSAK